MHASKDSMWWVEEEIFGFAWEVNGALILEIIRSVLWFYFTLIIDELSSIILLIYVELNIIHFELNWLNIQIEIQIRDIILYSYSTRSVSVFVFELKCGERWHQDPIPCESDLFPFLDGSVSRSLYHLDVTILKLIKLSLSKKKDGRD
jgi:hypothetical protein